MSSHRSPAGVPLGAGVGSTSMMPQQQHSSQSQPTHNAASTTIPAGVPLHGIYLNASVFKVRATGADVFYNYYRNGSLEHYMQSVLGDRYGFTPVAAAATARREGALSTSTSPSQHPLAEHDNATHSTSPLHIDGCGKGEETAAAAAAAVTASAPPLRASCYGEVVQRCLCPREPLLVNFDYSARVGRLMSEEARQRRQRDPVLAQMRSQRLNAVEEVVPESSEFTPMVTCAVHKNALEKVLSASEAHSGVAEAFQRAFHAARTTRTLNLHLCEEEEKYTHTSSARDVIIGVGEGSGTHPSSILSGLDVAIASMVVGETATFLIDSPATCEYSQWKTKSEVSSSTLAPGYRLVPRLVKHAGTLPLSVTIRLNARSPRVITVPPARHLSQYFVKPNISTSTHFPPQQRQQQSDPSISPLAFTQPQVLALPTSPVRTGINPFLFFTRSVLCSGCYCCHTSQDTTCGSGCAPNAVPSPCVVKPLSSHPLSSSLLERIERIMHGSTYDSAGVRGGAAAAAVKVAARDDSPASAVSAPTVLSARRALLAAVMCALGNRVMHSSVDRRWCVRGSSSASSLSAASPSSPRPASGREGASPSPSAAFISGNTVVSSSAETSAVMTSLSVSEEGDTTYAFDTYTLADAVEYVMGLGGEEVVGGKVDTSHPSGFLSSQASINRFNVDGGAAARTNTTAATTSMPPSLRFEAAASAVSAALPPALQYIQEDLMKCPMDSALITYHVSIFCALSGSYVQFPLVEKVMMGSLRMPCWLDMALQGASHRITASCVVFHGSQTDDDYLMSNIVRAVREEAVAVLSRVDAALQRERTVHGVPLAVEEIDSSSFCNPSLTPAGAPLTSSVLSPATLSATASTPQQFELDAAAGAGSSIGSNTALPAGAVGKKAASIMSTTAATATAAATPSSAAVGGSSAVVTPALYDYHLVMAPLVTLRREEHRFHVQCKHSVRSSVVTAESFFCVNTSVSLTTVRALTSNICALLEFYETSRLFGLSSQVAGAMDLPGREHPRSTLSKFQSRLTKGRNSWASVLLGEAGNGSTNVDTSSGSASPMNTGPPFSTSSNNMSSTAGVTSGGGDGANVSSGSVGGGLSVREASSSQLLAARIDPSKPGSFDEVARTAEFYPVSAAPSQPQRQGYHMLRRALWKAIRKAYVCVLLLTLDVDEAAMQPVQAVDLGAEEGVLPEERQQQQQPLQAQLQLPQRNVSSSSGDASNNNNNNNNDISKSEGLSGVSGTKEERTEVTHQQKQQQHEPNVTTASFLAEAPTHASSGAATTSPLKKPSRGSGAGGKQEVVSKEHRVRRYKYLAETFHLIAFALSELSPSMAVQAYEAASCSLMYNPFNPMVWALRSRIAVRLCHAARVREDLDVAIALTTAQLGPVDSRGSTVAEGGETSTPSFKQRSSQQAAELKQRLEALEQQRVTSETWLRDCGAIPLGDGEADAATAGGAVASGEGERQRTESGTQASLVSGMMSAPVTVVH